MTQENPSAKNNSSAILFVSAIVIVALMFATMLEVIFTGSSTHGSMKTPPFHTSYAVGYSTFLKRKMVKVIVFSTTPHPFPKMKYGHLNLGKHWFKGWKKVYFIDHKGKVHETTAFHFDTLWKAIQKPNFRVLKHLKKLPKEKWDQGLKEFLASLEEHSSSKPSN